MQPILSIMRIAGLPVMIMIGLVLYASVELAFDRNAISTETRLARTH